MHIVQRQKKRRLYAPENLPVVRVGYEDAMVGRQTLPGFLGCIQGRLLEVGDFGGVAGYGSECLFDRSDGRGHNGRHERDVGSLSRRLALLYSPDA